MSLELHELVALARSACSTSSDLESAPGRIARDAGAVDAAADDQQIVLRLRRLPRSLDGPAPAELRPPQQPERGLRIGDDAIAHPVERVGDLRLEGLQVLAHVELRAHVRQVPRAVEVDHLVGVADGRIEASRCATSRRPRSRTPRSTRACAVASGGSPGSSLPAGSSMKWRCLG